MTDEAKEPTTFETACSCGYSGPISVDEPKCPTCSSVIPVPKGIGKPAATPVVRARPPVVVPRSSGPEGLRIGRIVGAAVARLEEVDRQLAEMDALKKERAALRRIVRAARGVEFERPTSTEWFNPATQPGIPSPHVFVRPDVVISQRSAILGEFSDGNIVEGRHLPPQQSFS